MSDSSEASSRNNHPWSVQARAYRLLAPLEKGHERRRLDLESQRADQADHVLADAMTSLLHPQPLGRTSLLWNRSHGDN